MENLLLIGDSSAKFRSRIRQKLTIHVLDDMVNFTAWAANHAASITAIATNGGRGVKPTGFGRIIQC